jgi:TolB-like protein/Tfp pilus assembly protein PilF
MTPDLEPDLKLEIAHVLTIDVVAYSTLLIDEQSRLMAELVRTVKATPRFRQAAAEDKLIRLPTGDGMALVFLSDAEAPIECAMQIAASLKEHPEIRLRMGIHSGPVNSIRDVNDRTNLAGAGIDMAQRVMDCGDAGHILVSKHVADDLAPYPRWNRYLHDLGECEVKHGRKVFLFNFYSESFGNPEPPKKLKCAPEQKKSQRFVRAGKITLFGVLALAVCLAAVFFFARTQLPSERSIAVLPFIDFSPARNEEYFSDGITEQITSLLGSIHGLFVVARTSAFIFRNSTLDVRDIGRKLGVSNVLEGSVSRSPGRVRVTAQLISVSSGYHIWSKTYDLPEEDILSLQIDVAQKVASALRIELHVAETERLQKPPTSDPEAFDLYLRGRYLLNKRTSHSIQKARTLFELSVAKDQRFASGQAGLADSYILLAEYGLLPLDEALEKAWPHADAAISADPGLADGYVSRAMLQADFEWNWAAAEVDFKKALELNMNSAATRHWYALYLAELGRCEEALEAINAAQRLDPLSPIIHAAKGKILWIMRRYDLAIQECEKALELEPDFPPALFVIAQAYSQEGKYGEAVEAADKFVQFAPRDVPDLEAAYVRAVAGDITKSEKIVGETVARFGGCAPYDLATVCVAKQDYPAALVSLEKAIEQRSLDVVWIRVDPRLDPIRADPRFQSLILHVTQGFKKSLSAQYH